MFQNFSQLTVEQVASVVGVIRYVERVASVNPEGIMGSFFCIGRHGMVKHNSSIDGLC